MQTTTITCPHCHKPFAIEDVLKDQIAEELLATEQKKHEIELSLQRDRIFKEVKEKTDRESSIKLKMLQEENLQQEKRLEESIKSELATRKKINKLEDERKSFELEKQRQLDHEREKIREEAEKRAHEANSLKLHEAEKKLRDALTANESVTKANEDLKRKLEQGSQQLQGEVLELELEELLKKEFPMDEIIPVKKGIRGADLIQNVIDKTEKVCGSILWESKNAKWKNDFIDTLRVNQRVNKSDIAVIVTANPPATVKSFAYSKGVWITSRSMCLPLAQALRIQLNQVFQTKQINIGKSEKKELVYEYLSGHEFRQRVEGIVETFLELQEELETEKRWYTKKWAAREKSIRKAIDNTLGMHGDLHGIMGGTLPEIKQLQLEAQT